MPFETETNQLENHARKCNCYVPVQKKLLTDDLKPLLYTRIESYELFTKLHDFVALFVKRRYHEIIKSH